MAHFLFSTWLSSGLRHLQPASKIISVVIHRFTMTSFICGAGRIVRMSISQYGHAESQPDCCQITIVTIRFNR